MQEEKYTKFKNEIWKDKNIKGYEKLVLIYLISYNNETLGYSYPTRKQIEEGTGIALKTLDKVLKSLIDKGYITKKEYKSNTGRNNIYYIHKYLVVSKKAQDLENAPQDTEVNEIVNENGREQSTNELLVIQNCKLTKKLTKEDIVELNKMDTDRLLQAINQANKTQGDKAYHINYIKKAYENVQNNPPVPQRKPSNEKTINISNNRKKDKTKENNVYVNNNYPVKTKYHNINEHFRNYTEEELEEKLLKMQEKRRGITQ